MWKVLALSIFLSYFASSEADVCQNGTVCFGPECCKQNTSVEDCPSGYHLCPSGKTCCPDGYTCLFDKWCIKASSGTDGKLSREVKPKFQDDPCEDDACPAGQTCCPMSTGEAGCCPLPNAVCCSDGLHCCPEGYSCSQGRCVMDKTKTWLDLVQTQRKMRLVETDKTSFSSSAVLEKSVAVKEDSELGIVSCGGGYYCPDGSTCCKLYTGQWGCCPFAYASCCADGVHCCRSGLHCIGGQCYQSKYGKDFFLSEPWKQKVPALRKAHKIE